MAHTNFDNSQTPSHLDCSRTEGYEKASGRAAIQAVRQIDASSQLISGWMVVIPRRGTVRDGGRVQVKGVGQAGIGVVREVLHVRPLRRSHLQRRR